MDNIILKDRCHPSTKAHPNNQDKISLVNSFLNFRGNINLGQIQALLNLNINQKNKHRRNHKMKITQATKASNQKGLIANRIKLISTQ